MLLCGACIYIDSLASQIYLNTVHWKAVNAEGALHYAIVGVVVLEYTLALYNSAV